MATISGLSAEQLKAELNKIPEAERATSKKAGKYMDALKVLQPAGFSQETVDNAKAKLSTSTQVPGAAGSSLGLTGGSSSIPSGVPDLNSIYNTALTGANELELELKNKKQALVDAQTNINDNPFYSEATRVGKLNKLSTQAQAEISNLENEVASKKADAQIKVNIANQQYGLNSDAHKQAVSDLNNMIATGAINGLSGTDLANLSVATGLSSSAIKAIQDKAKFDQIKPQIITNTDNSGKVTVSVIDGATGKVISQNSLGNVGTASTDKAPETNKYLTQAKNILKSSDAMNAGDEDGKLSLQEQQSAFNKILALVGGNEDLAKQVFQQTWDVEGYENYEG